ncbi:hypothetical protein OSB04_016305 [Centaurea solstitialis]|uniref:Transposase n=1 Tax=Centaurea solstitialis TaxID=347529 RepID=A0AA38WHB2_9ASTR|nr:hypothetical protein OSB04_016305 [Centaurea solstitialis]
MSSSSSTSSSPPLSPIQFSEYDEDERPSSQQTRRPAKNRDRLAAHEKLVSDYFSNNLVYDDINFKRRGRGMQGVKGFSPLQKCASAIRQLAYGTVVDAMDEYLKMSETTSRECFALYILHEQQYGFPGMLGSMDCMHWDWKNCPVVMRLKTIKQLILTKKWKRQLRGAKRARSNPNFLEASEREKPTFAARALPLRREQYPSRRERCLKPASEIFRNIFLPYLLKIRLLEEVAWRGQYHRGDHPGPSIILEAVASYDLWIWHAFFGVPGATNDIVVVNQSPVFNDLFEGKAPDSSFNVNGTHYKHGYYLTDDIYPWPTDPKRVEFTKRQESARKDIERAFAVLQEKWHIITNMAQAWTKKKLRYTMYTCIILHIMNREDEGFSHYSFDENEVLADDIEVNISKQERAQNVNQVKNKETHLNLRANLTEHVF